MRTRAWLAPLLVALGGWAVRGQGLHPDVTLLDAEGAPVLSSGRPVSAPRSCLPCHDSGFIATHSYHAQAGGDERHPPGASGARPWDTSPGLFGRWDPLAYRHLTPDGWTPQDLDLPGWARVHGPRHVGGGPLAGLGAPMDCFLCHLAAPATDARAAELRAGRFEWAGTATLARTGLVRPAPDGQGWLWERRAFGERASAAAPQALLRLGEPRAGQCGACHGVVHTGPQPLRLQRDELLAAPATGLTGQVFSAQRLRDTGLNLAGKEGLTRPWDVHAARLLECSSCHGALNDPEALAEGGAALPGHLQREARRPTIGEYLRQPSHDLAKGDTPQGTVARRLAGTAPGCVDCHETAAHARFLPHAERHLARLDCAACHVPRAWAPLRRETDWTLPDPRGAPRVTWRGVEGEAGDPRALITGFAPPLLPRAGRLAPMNLHLTWLWVGHEPPRPVRLEDLRAALHEDDDWHPEVLAALDADRDGTLSGAERILADPAARDLVARRLEAVGVATPRLRGELQPLTLAHGVAPAREALIECAACHVREGRAGQPLLLAARAPLSDTIELVPDAGLSGPPGRLVRDGPALLFEPQPERSGFVLLGRMRPRWVDLLGGATLLCAALGAALHGGLRVLLAARRGAA